MKKLIVLLSILAVLISFTAVPAQSNSTKIVDKKELKEKATVFPNPFSQKLTINVPEKSKVSIYNSWGELIYKEVIETLTSINTSDSKWKCGIYMVIIIPDRDRGWSEKQTIKVHKTD